MYLLTTPQPIHKLRVKDTCSHCFLVRYNISYYSSHNYVTFLIIIKINTTDAKILYLNPKSTLWVLLQSLQKDAKRQNFELAKTHILIWGWTRYHSAFLFSALILQKNVLFKVYCLFFHFCGVFLRLILQFNMPPGIVLMCYLEFLSTKKTLMYLMEKICDFYKRCSGISYRVVGCRFNVNKWTIWYIQ